MNELLLGILSTGLEEGATRADQKLINENSVLE